MGTMNDLETLNCRYHWFHIGKGTKRMDVHVTKQVLGGSIIH